MGAEYFCPTCGKSFEQGGRCQMCGEVLETIDLPQENGDSIDDELLGEIHHIPVTQEAGAGRVEDSFEDDY